MRHRHNFAASCGGVGGGIGGRGEPQGLDECETREERESEQKKHNKGPRAIEHCELQCEEANTSEQQPNDNADGAPQTSKRGLKVTASGGAAAKLARPKTTAWAP